MGVAGEPFGGTGNRFITSPNNNMCSCAGGKVKAGAGAAACPSSSSSSRWGGSGQVSCWKGQMQGLATSYNNSAAAAGMGKDKQSSFPA